MGKSARKTTRAARAGNRKPAQPDIVIGNEIDGAGATETGSDRDTGTGPVDGSIIDPGSISASSGGSDSSGSGDSAAGNVDPTTGKRRYKRRASKAADPLSVSEISSLTEIALSAHAMLYGLTQNPLFDIDEKDAEKITLLSSNVARHYDNIPGVSPKVKDWILFMQGAAAIYAPRFMVWRMQRAQAKAARQQAPQHRHAPQNVAPAPNAPNQPQPVRPAPASADVPAGPSPGVASRSPLPPNNFAPQGGPTRQQPGLAGIDGADLPLKLN